MHKIFKNVKRVEPVHSIAKRPIQCVHHQEAGCTIISMYDTLGGTKARVAKECEVSHQCVLDWVGNRTRLKKFTKIDIHIIT